MPRQSKERPLVIRRYGEIELARGMGVKGGVYGDIEVVARYKQHSKVKCFPQSAPLSERLAWQHGMIEQLRLASSAPRKTRTRAVADVTTFAQDIDRYLLSLDEARHRNAETWLSYWRQWYGHQPRTALTLGDCQAFFQYVTPKSAPTKQFGGSAKNKLRTYCLNVWRFCDGRSHECPVRDIPVFAEPHHDARELDPASIVTILGAMGDTRERAFLGMMFVTGARPVEIMALRPEACHLDETPPYVAISGAKGGKNRILTLPLFGVAYTRDFLRLEAWRMRTSPFYAMQRAAKACGLAVYTGATSPAGKRRTRISPYTLRHAYAMNLRRSGAGIDDIADALGHRDLETTRRYAQAIPERQAVITKAMWDRLGV